MNDSNDITISEHLAKHQQRGTAGWSYQQVMQNLHSCGDMFIFRFKLEIPSVPLRIDRLRPNCLGHYRAGFNDFGLLNEIAIDSAYLKCCLQAGAWWRILAVLLHEQLHFWQQLHGKPAKPGRGNYHNVEYRDKAQTLGLLVASRGGSSGYVDDSPFFRLLKECGVEVPDLVLSSGAGPSRSRVGSKLKRWICGCQPPVRLRVGRATIRVRCMDCGQMFNPDIS